MRRADVASTKSNLLRLSEDLELVRSGHELLDQKRQILLEEILDFRREARLLRGQVEAELFELYETLRRALLAGGTEAAWRETVGVRLDAVLAARERSVMGVGVPLLEWRVVGEEAGRTAPGAAFPEVAEVGRRVRGLLATIVHLAELEASLRRLIAEMRRTRRRVNALEKVFLPDYRDTIAFIRAALEEKDRESLFQLGRLKERKERTGNGVRTARAVANPRTR